MAVTVQTNNIGIIPDKGVLFMGERHQIYLRTTHQLFKPDTVDDDSVVGRLYRNSILGLHIQFLMPYDSIIFLANLLRFHSKHLYDDGDRVMSVSPLHITSSEYHTHYSGRTDGSYTFTRQGHLISHVEFYFKALDIISIFRLAVF
ncbi:MAG: hypothetical protein D3908_10855 [Candidatus Electrothrix sp. AUS4]|nr:hypothetical protein [Candidatus Electrothrix sp. AUS4]